MTTVVFSMEIKHSNIFTIKSLEMVYVFLKLKNWLVTTKQHNVISAHMVIKHIKHISTVKHLVILYGTDTFGGFIVD